MLCVWFLNFAPQNVEKLEFIYPIVGHSFLPSDRVFARIEKRIKNYDVIIDPVEYDTIFSDCGTVIPLGGKVFDWKSSVQDVIRPPGQWHFQFNPSKRIFFKKNSKADNILIQGEVHYRSQIGTFRSICKRGKVIKDTNQPAFIEKGIKISPQKFTDVLNLLRKHFGENWRDLDSLIFYKNLEDQDRAEENDNEPEAECERMEEVSDLLI